jgi:hypothetical protein
MADTTAGARRRRWPYHGRAQLLLPLAGLVLTIGGFLPWLDTAFGASFLGQTAQLLVLSAGAIGLAGAAWRRRGAVVAHAAIVAVVGLGTALWYLGSAVATLPAFGEAWVPGPGLVLTLLSGGVAAYALLRLTRMSTADDGGAPVRADR